MKIEISLINFLMKLSFWTKVILAIIIILAVDYFFYEEVILDSVKDFFATNLCYIMRKLDLITACI